MIKIEENILNFKKAMELLAKGYTLIFNDEMWRLRYGFIKLNCFGHIVDKEEEDYNGSFFNDWNIFKGDEFICRLVYEKPNALVFYFTKDDKEYDICLKRSSHNYYLLYLNYYGAVHYHYNDITVFIEPLNEILNLLPRIDNFNEYLDIYIIDGFHEHCDLIEYLSLEKQDFKIFEDNVYLIKKGKVKN